MRQGLPEAFRQIRDAVEYDVGMGAEFGAGAGAGKHGDAQAVTGLRCHFEVVGGVANGGEVFRREAGRIRARRSRPAA